MKQMLINVAQPEEKRVAVVDQGRLIDLDLELQSYTQTKANLYLGKIVRVESSLEAVFIDYGAERHGFLPMKNIAPELFQKKAMESSRQDTEQSQPRIQDLVKEGQEFIVQVEKEERGNKGAALTTYVTLAGRYLVFMPNNPGAGGISRRIEDENRGKMKKMLSSLDAPEHVGVILRTAGVGRTQEELQWDLDYLQRLWDVVKKAAKNYKTSRLLFRDSSLMTRTIRDSLRDDISDVYIDDASACQEYKDFISTITPDYVDKIKFYDDPIPLFTKFAIEEQVESAYAYHIDLPSGGAIVIDHNEALVCIDVNSARDTKGNDIEATALNTNLEAAEEIARQLRIRDIGGLIVIDFIDMRPEENKQEVEKKLSQSLSLDRAKIQLGSISRFGLLEMSRQRLRPSLQESTTTPCSRCMGVGYIRNTESQSLAIMRQLYHAAAEENTVQLQVKLPINVATYLLNEKRADFLRMESLYGINIAVLPIYTLQSPQYALTLIKTDGSQKVISSHEVKSAGFPKNKNLAAMIADRIKKDSAAVQTSSILVPAPKARKQNAVAGILKKLSGIFCSTEQSSPSTTTGNQRNTRNQAQNRNRGPRAHTAGNGSSANNRNRRRRPSSGNNRRRRPENSGSPSDNTSANASGNTRVQRP